MRNLLRNIRMLNMHSNVYDRNVIPAMVAQLFHNFYDVQYIILLSFSFLFAYSDG